MGRRKSSPAEDFATLVARLPWWAGVVLALASYGLLHQLATRPGPVTVQPGQIADALQGAMISGVSMVAQYIVPLLCLAGALMSFIQRRKRQALVGQVTRSSSAQALHGMSWQEFEMLVGEGFRLHGYTVTETGGGGPDGGVDLVLRKDGDTHLVQCKQWKAYKVGVDVVRELYGVMAARGAAKGFVVTSGTFTPEALAFAEGRHVVLVDGVKLLRLIQQVQDARAVEATPTQPLEPAAPATPACPKCRAPMVLRTAAKGSRAGSRFWGCSQFPECRGTRAQAA